MALAVCEAIKMAIADFGGTVNGKKIEFVYADHQNKADIAATKSREWFDQAGVDMLIAGSNSATNLAMARVAAEKKKTFFAIGGATARLTNEECTPYTIHYAYDTVALAKGTGGALVREGGKSWYFLAADYAFGQSLESDTTRVIKENGGTVVGGAKHPLATPDFSSFMLQAQAPEKDGQVFARCKTLLKHPDFSLKNPNRARSLIGTLFTGNPGAFHRADAAGYIFWADRVLELDAANPQLAARMARVMDRYSQLAEPYRSAARAAVARVAAKTELSNDVREIVSRALEQ